MPIFLFAKMIMYLLILVSLFLIEFCAYSLSRRLFNKKPFEEKLNSYWDGKSRYYVFAYALFFASMTILSALSTFLYSSITIDVFGVTIAILTLLLAAWLSYKHDQKLRITMSNEEVTQEAHLCVFEAMIYLDKKREIFMKKTISDLIMISVVFTVLLISIYFSNFIIGWLLTSVLLFLSVSMENKKKKQPVDGNLTNENIADGNQASDKNRNKIMYFLSSFVTSLGFLLLAPMAIILTLSSISESVSQDQNAGEWV